MRVQRLAIALLLALTAGSGFGLAKATSAIDRQQAVRAKAEARRRTALGALRPGMTYAQVRRRLEEAGWRPYWNPVRPDISRCQVHRRICLTHPETQACWRDEGVVRCSFEFVGTGRAQPRHKDDAVSIEVRIEGVGRRVYDRHHEPQPFGGPG